MEFLVELIVEFICGIFENIIDDKKVSLVVRIVLYSILFLFIIAFITFVLVLVCKNGNVAAAVIVGLILVFLIAVWIYAIKAFIKQNKNNKK